MILLLYSLYPRLIIIKVIKFLNAVLPGAVVSNSGGKIGTGDQSTVSSLLSPNVTSFLNGRNYNNTLPKAYLNWILFDNQFKYVTGGVVQVLSGSSKQALVAPLQTISKNGYLYVYVSNESPQDVYFDDITVKHYTGPLVQEQSYYPFGVQMAAISDKALKKSNTPYKYDGGVELEEELNYYNTFFRKYDAQIGRFTGVDILSELVVGLTPYQFGGNNPVVFNDPTGLLLEQGDPDPDPDPDPQYGSIGPSGDPLEGLGFSYSGGGGGGGGGWGGWSNFGNALSNLGGGGYGNYLHGGGGRSKNTYTSYNSHRSTNRWQLFISSSQNGNIENFFGFMGSGNPGPLQPLSPWEVEQYEKATKWSHHDKRFGGKHDLKKDKEGNIYEQDKDGKGEAYPTGYKIKGGVVTETQMSPVQDNLVPPKFYDPTKIHPNTPKAPLTPNHTPTPVSPGIPDVNPIIEPPVFEPPVLEPVVPEIPIFI